VGAGYNRAASLVRLYVSRDQLEQGCLACAVSADQGQPIPLTDIDVEILKQPARALH